MGKIKTALCIFAACACAFAADSDIAKIKEKADAGDAQSQLAIGVLYSSGKGGVQKNPALALEYIKAAAEKNFAPAQTFLGCAYAEGKIVPRNMQEAIRWRELGAQNGTIADKWSLGNAFLYGYLVPKDQIKAVYWITQAADKGHPEAILKLVEIYKNLQKPEEEKKWARKFAELEIEAAKKGNIEAMTSVANQYMSGKGGLERNRPQAIFWYKKAADMGGKEAMEKVAQMYAKGRFLPKKPEKAQEYFEKLAAMDNAYCFKISSFYADGSNGFPRDDDMSTKWLERGAQNADDSTKLYVAWRFWKGFETAKNPTKAIYWCSKVLETAPKGEEAQRAIFGAFRVAERMISDISNNLPPPENFGKYYSQYSSKFAQ